MTIEELLEKYKKKYPGVPWEMEKDQDIYKKYDEFYIFSKKNRKTHSYDDAPAVVFETGTKEWRKNGKLHRENDKPAVIWGPGSWDNKGGKEWWYEGKRHRENDKPAIIYGIGTKQGIKEWWYHGEPYDEPAIKLSKQKKQRINKLTVKKSSKQKQREDLLKEFVCEMLDA